MIKHLIEFTYTTVDNAKEKKNSVTIEFPEVQNKYSTNLKIELRNKLNQSHNLLMQKFPTLNWAMPFVKEITNVTIIN